MADYQSLRREYGDKAIDIATLDSDPLQQFQWWLDEAITCDELDPTAFVLSTVDSEGAPDNRVLLLKEIQENGFAFFTDYRSVKGMQLQTNPKAAASFYWPIFVRSVRMRGICHKMDKALSNTYFALRPYISQIAAVLSPQSQVLSSREDLVAKIDAIATAQQPIDCPDHWGGYIFIPSYIEFFQGRNNRINDRIAFNKVDDQWQAMRLAP